MPGGGLRGSARSHDVLENHEQSLVDAEYETYAQRAQDRQRLRQQIETLKVFDKFIKCWCCH